MFALVRQEHAHISVVNRWTAQVLSWCLGDPQLKGNVLRFIDVLPSLRNPRAITRHVREYFPTAKFRLPPALRLGVSLARPGLLTAPALAAVIHRLVEQVARQFIAESRPEGAAQTVEQLARRGAMCSFDILGEQVLSDAEADRYAEQCKVLLRDVSRAYVEIKAPVMVSTCGPKANLSVKPSALTPRFNPGSPASSIEQAARRLLPILRFANRYGALVNLDMEQYALRDLTLALSQQLLVHPRIGRHAKLGIVMQAYLRDAEPVAETLLAWLAKHERSITIRLVKGAYWDYECAEAARTYRPVPVYEDKVQSDAAFERLTQRLLGAHPLVTTAIASHNVRSIAHAMAVAELLKLSKDQMEFQLLYGMGDALLSAIERKGYPVRVYTPIGQLIPGMGYLVRRLLENTANESFLRQDILEERSAEELLRPPHHRVEVSQPASKTTVEWRGGTPLTDFSKAPERERMAQALQAVRKQFGARYPVRLGGRVQEHLEHLTVCNPAYPTEVLGEIDLAGPAEAYQAVALAEAAQASWAATAVPERVACLSRAAGLMRERRHELAAWQTVEIGKTWPEADADVAEAIDYLEYYSHDMLRLAEGIRLSSIPGEQNRLVYMPRGIAVVIAPWNFPVAILTGMASAALVTGNCVILKPAEQSSIIGYQMADILQSSGVPRDVVQCLPGRGQEAGAALVRHPGVHLVLFTGSKEVGLSIVETCAHVEPEQRDVKHVVAEMGGKNAIIVDEDADLDAAIQGTLQSAFGYAGQKCSAASRIIVHAAVYDRFLERLCRTVDRLVVGDPADPSTDLGPLIEASAQQRLRDAGRRAQTEATIAYRYPPERLPSSGHFVGPMVVTEISPSHPVATEELFGPLVCIFRAHSFVEALRLANDSHFALTGGIYSRSPSHIQRAIRAFDVGNLYVNRSITGATVGRQPFGGHRLSGLGTKAGGPDYLRQLMVAKVVSVNTARHGMPLE